VSHVWVDGELLVADGTLMRMDTQELAAKAAYWKARIDDREPLQRAE
jgi:hypothetical protein